MRRPGKSKQPLAIVFFIVCSGLTGCSSDVQLAVGRKNYSAPSVTGAPTTWRASDPMSASGHAVRVTPAYELPAVGTAVAQVPPAPPRTAQPEIDPYSAVSDPIPTTTSETPALDRSGRPLVWIVPEPTDMQNNWQEQTASAQMPAAAVVPALATTTPTNPVATAAGQSEPLKLAVLEEGCALAGMQAGAQGAEASSLPPEAGLYDAVSDPVPTPVAPAPLVKKDPVAPPTLPTATPPVAPPPMEPAHLPPPTRIAKAAPELPPGMARPPVPLYRIVHNKRITLNYDVDNVGPSGVARVELWFTRDNRVWQKHPATPQSGFPFVVEVEGEGLYGFTLVARNALDQGQGPPAPGAVPQVLVEVDLTQPVVKLIGTRLGLLEGTPAVRIDWQATDKNLGSTPIRLSYASAAKGPWQPIVTDLENWGSYLWKLPPGLPNKLYVRVEALDRAGNVTSAQTHEPLVLDQSQPRVSVRSVD